MKKNLFSAILICFLISSLGSCKKDSHDAQVNSDMLGTYKFISLTASTVSTSTINDGTTVDKTITTSEYTTKNNTGTLTIDATTMTSTGLSYSIDTTVTVVSYEDGVLIDSYDAPFQFDVPSSNSTGNYKWVTSDSVYFASTSIFSSDGTTTPSGASGSKLKLVGDKLYVTGSKEQNSSDNSAGFLITTNSKGSVVATYQKQ